MTDSSISSARRNILRLARVFLFIWFVSLKALYLWHSYAKISFFLPQGFYDFSVN